MPSLWHGLKGHLGQLAWVLGGKGMLLAGNALLMLMLARHLDLETYGLFATVIGAQVLVSRILLLGLDGGVVRLANLQELRPKQVVRSGLMILAYTSIALVVLSAAGWILLEKSGRWPVWAVGAAVTGSIGMALIDYSYFCRLAELGYRTGALLQGGPAVARFAITGVALYTIPAYPAAVFLAYGGVNLACGAWQFLVLLHRASEAPGPGVVGRTLRYSAWSGVANVTAALNLHQGTFLLVMFGKRSEAGVYGLALTVALGIFAVKNAYYEYVYPQILQNNDPKSLPRFLLRSMAGGAAIAALGVAGLAAAGWLMPRLVPHEMWAAVPVLYYLGGSMLLLFVQVPLDATSQYLLKPQYTVLGWLVRVASTAILGLALVQAEGALGAAKAQLLGSVLAFGVIAVLIALSSRGAIRAGRAPALRTCPQDGD